jgi:hypothetical protein
MTREKDALDSLIRSSLCEPIVAHEPSATVRESLLARAAQATQSVAGESVPPLVDELRDAGECSEELSWWEIERCQNENFSGWSNPNQALGWLDPFREAKRCRVSVAC